MISHLLQDIIRPAWHRFRANEEGSSTIEAVLWLPFFVIFFVMIADVSFVFHRQTQLLTVLQDGNRALSVGRLADLQELESFIQNRVSYLTDNATVESVITSGVVSTQVLIPINDLVAVGMFKFLSDYNISVESQQFIEY